MDLKIGCPIWSFKGWVGNFYPEGTKPSQFLEEYARRLTAIEGNTTFYAVPAEKTLEDWAAATPETFRFCAKVPKAISHARKLEEGIDRARQFVQIMGRLGPRLGPMFLQLPPSYSPRHLEDLQKFLEAWPGDVRLGVEVRHLDWFESPFNEVLNRTLSSHNMARVVIDTRPIRSLDGDKILRGSVYQTLLEARRRKPDVPVFMERTADFLFLRYIGHPSMEQNRELLREWADRVAGEINQGADAFVFCHSPENLTAPHLCREFHRLVAEQANIAPLPWETLAPGAPEQPALF
ncbi:MAG TPA: DUF72 domain-containing protein [Anaerolineales bacterium]